MQAGQQNIETYLLEQHELAQVLQHILVSGLQQAQPGAQQATAGQQWQPITYLQHVISGFGSFGLLELLVQFTDGHAQQPPGFLQQPGMQQQVGEKQ